MNLCWTWVHRYLRWWELSNTWLGLLACAFCLLLLGLANYVIPKSFCLCRRGPFPLYSSSFPLDHRQGCCSGLAQGLTGKRCVASQRRSWCGVEPCKLSWAAHHPQQRHFAFVLCQEITFLKAVKYRLNPSGRSEFVSFPLVLMGPQNSSVSPEKKSFVSGTKSHNFQSWNNKSPRRGPFLKCDLLYF